MKRIFGSAILTALPLAALADEIADAPAVLQTACQTGELNGTAAQITTAFRGGAGASGGKADRLPAEGTRRLDV